MLGFLSLNSKRVCVFCVYWIRWIIAKRAVNLPFFFCLDPACSRHPNWQMSQFMANDQSFLHYPDFLSLKFFEPRGHSGTEIHSEPPCRCDTLCVFQFQIARLPFSFRLPCFAFGSKRCRFCHRLLIACCKLHIGSPAIKRR